jgi:hypothetical protein
MLHNTKQRHTNARCCLQACGWPLARLLPGLRGHPRLLVTPAEQLYAGAAMLQQQLRLSEEGLALALRRWVLCYVPWYQHISVPRVVPVHW